MVIENENPPNFLVRAICRPRSACLFDDENLSCPPASLSRQRKRSRQIQLIIGAGSNE